MQVLRMREDEQRELRKVIRQQVAAVSPPGEVDVVTDIAMHAAAEAFIRAEEILAASPSPAHQLAALGPTVSILAGRGVTLRDALKDFALKNDLPVHEGLVRVGGA